MRRSILIAAILTISATTASTTLRDQPDDRLSVGRRAEREPDRRARRQRLDRQLVRLRAVLRHPDREPHPDRANRRPPELAARQRPPVRATARRRRHRHHVLPRGLPGSGRRTTCAHTSPPASASRASTSTSRGHAATSSSIGGVPGGPSTSRSAPACSGPTPATGARGPQRRLPRILLELGLHAAGPAARSGISVLFR